MQKPIGVSSTPPPSTTLVVSSPDRHALRAKDATDNSSLFHSKRTFVVKWKRRLTLGPKILSNFSDRLLPVGMDERVCMIGWKGGTRKRKLEVVSSHTATPYLRRRSGTRGVARIFEKWGAKKKKIRAKCAKNFYLLFFFFCTVKSHAH